MVNAFGVNKTYHGNGIAPNPTASESDSFEEEDGISIVSSESDFALQMHMPNGYILSEKQRGRSPVSSAKDGENDQGLQRLVLLAKHPNATEGEVASALHKKQQKKHRRPVSFGETTSMGSPAVSPDLNSKGSINQANFAAKLASAREEDFDEVWSVGNRSEDTTLTSPKSFFESISEKLFSPKRTDTQEASLASRSLASESTRKISNVDEVARRERIRKELGDYTCKERVEMGWNKLFKTRNGKITLCLLLVLLLAMIVTVAAALATNKNKGETSQLPVNPSTMIPRINQGPTEAPTNFPTEVPTKSPTKVVTNSPTEVPTDAPTVDNSDLTNPTNENIFATPFPTPVPSPFPSPAPSTISSRFPTASPTPRPSKGPTPEPTRLPTFSPTKNPTPIPTTQLPTASPTTSMPSASPTITFLETPFEEFGDVIPGTQTEDRLGHSLALSDDGLIMAVGAPGSNVNGKDQAGLVQVYVSVGNEWVARGPPLTGRNALDQFGSSIALSADGNVLAISEPTFAGAAGDRSGNVRVYVWTPFNRYDPLGQEIEGVAASDHFGISIAMSQDGRRLVVGAPYHDNGGGSRNVSGQVTVFELKNDAWEPLGNTLEGFGHLDWFGWKVEMSDDGNIIAVGAPRNLQFGGYVNCYKLVNGTWQQLGNIIRNSIEPLRYDDNFGSSIRISGNNRIAVGSPGKNINVLDAGIVVVYELNENDQWNLLGDAITMDKPRDADQMGFSIDLRGNALAVGIPGKDNPRSHPGRVSLYQYNPDSSAWIPHPDVIEGEAGSNFGFSVRLTGALAVGSTVTAGSNAGSVRVYKQT